MRTHLAPRRPRVRAPFAAGLAVLLAGCGSSSGGGSSGGGGGTPPSTNVVLDVTSVSLSGSFSLAAGGFPASVFDAGLIGVRGGDGGFAPLGYSSDGAYAQRIVSGIYDVEYRSTATGPSSPHNPMIATQTGADLTVGGTFNVDVPRVTATGAFTLNGGPFPASIYDYGEFYLVPLAGGDPVYFGRSDQPGAAVPVVPGTYDVEWRYVTGATVPANQRAVVRPAVSIQANGGIPVNVTVVAATGALTLDGAPFPVAATERGRILLRRPGTPDEVDFGPTNLPLARKVVPTLYDVVYTHESGGTVPRNEDVTVAQGVVISIATPLFPVNVKTGLVSLQPGLNGGPCPTAATQRGDLYFRGASPLDVFPMGPTNTAVTTAVRVVQGTYDVLYRHVSGDLVPQNTNALVKQAVGVAGNVVVPVAVSAVAVTGSFRLNGDPFPSSPLASATIRLRGAPAGDEFALGRTHVTPAAVQVVTGTYDVLYEADAIGGDVPLNRGHVLQQGVSLATSQTLDVAVTSHHVNLLLRLDGASFPTSPSAAADLWLVDPSTKRLFPLLHSTDGASQDLALIPGTYDAVYESVGGGASVPANEFSTVDSVTIP
jgi:hypothetical protein